jgi:hypothetical protein
VVMKRRYIPRRSSDGAYWPPARCSTACEVGYVMNEHAARSVVPSFAKPAKPG